jgi:hypothetical protein
MDPRDAEAFLGLSVGAFDHIPPYARPRHWKLSRRSEDSNKRRHLDRVSITLL